MTGNYWEASFEMRRADDGSIEKTPGIWMNTGFQDVLSRAVKTYSPEFKAADQFLLIAVAKQDRRMLEAMKDSMPGAFDAGAVVPVRQLVAAISARHNFSAVIGWLQDQGLDPTESYPAIGGWEEVQPWREALTKGHMDVITAFTSRQSELLTRALPLTGSDLISPIALMCSNGHAPAALQLADSYPELLDVGCQLEGEPMDTPSYLDRIGQSDAATILRSSRAAHAARLAIESISADEACFGGPR